MDLVIGELSRNELPDSQPSTDKHPYFFTIPEMATRKLVFDLLVHRDVYPEFAPSLMAYDTCGRAPPGPGPHPPPGPQGYSEELESVGYDHRRLRLLEFPATPNYGPRYSEN